MELSARWGRKQIGMDEDPTAESIGAIALSRRGKRPLRISVHGRGTVMVIYHCFLTNPSQTCENSFVKTCLEHLFFTSLLSLSPLRTCGRRGSCFRSRASVGAHVEGADFDDDPLPEDLAHAPPAANIHGPCSLLLRQCQVVCPATFCSNCSNANSRVWTCTLSGVIPLGMTSHLV